MANYIGGNTFLEMGVAFYLNKPIYLLNIIPEIDYKEELLGMKPTIINNNLEICCGKESIKVLEIQREGKKVQKIGEFMLGSQIRKGSVISNV